MVDTSDYQAGINLGGWISQYRDKGKEHFDSFILERDIKQIASWGMDHIRLPFDYPILEDDDNPLEYKEEGFKYIDNCIEWCHKHGLNIVLDLHKSPGYSFNTLDANTLFDNPEQQRRFISLWETLAKRYLSLRDNVWFELINEIVEPNSERWNKLAHRTIEAIRQIDPTRIIVYGGNHYNSIRELKNIAVLDDDPYIVYNFHFYWPHLFTHQKARWSQASVAYNKTTEYPGEFPGVKELLQEHPEYTKKLEEHLDLYADKNTMRDALQQAVDFMNNTKQATYCGEYGVYRAAPADSRTRWHRDFIDLMKEFKIGRAVWSYKGMGFGFVDENSDVVDSELVNIVSEK